MVKKLTRPNGSETSYTYDGLNRLLEISNTDGDATILSNYSYRYNEQDQRDKETITGDITSPSLTDSLNISDYNSLNQLLANSNPEETFVYDDDGNMVEGYTHEGYRFTALYDQENRLSSLSFTDDNGVVHETRYTYRYDSFLSSIEKLENNDTISKTQIIRNGKFAIQERDGNNSVTNEYVWGKNLGGGIGGLLQLNQNGSEYFYLYDGKGNVTSVIDNSVNTVAKYKYDTFGKLISRNGTLEQPFQSSTKRFDSQSGLNYYGYRFYNPSIERWMNRDPLGETGGINLYGFTGNNPVNWVDPWGLLGVLNDYVCYWDFTKCYDKACYAKDMEAEASACALALEVCLATGKTGRKKPKKPEKPLPVDTTPKQPGPKITTKPEKWGEKPKVKPEEYLP